MKVTQRLVEELYNLYNKKYFDNNLNTPIYVSHTRRSKNTLGYFNHRNFITIFSNPFSVRFNTENDLKGTIIHEMVHARLFQKYGYSNCGHTPRFHSMLSSIMRSEFGISYKRSRFHQRALGTIGQTKEVPASTLIPAPITSSVITIGTLVKSLLGIGKVVEILKTENKTYYRVEGQKNFLSPTLITIA